nr:hypothetical protein [uncultured Pedobacter sp.]
MIKQHTHAKLNSSATGMVGKILQKFVRSTEAIAEYRTARLLPL